MKTPMQELIEKVNQWMLNDNEVLNNPLDYEEYMVIYASQMLSVKMTFIDMCESMLEKEKKHKRKSIKRCHCGAEFDGIEGYALGKLDALERNIIAEEDAEFIWSLLPNWLHDHPKGLDPNFYGTGTREGDIKVSNKVKRILNL